MEKKTYRIQKEMARVFIENLRKELFSKATKTIEKIKPDDNYFWCGLWNYSCSEDALFFKNYQNFYVSNKQVDFYSNLLNSIQFYLEGSYPKSISILLDLQQDEEGKVTIYDSLGKVYYYNLQFEESKTAFLKALELMPDDAFATNGMGLFGNDENKKIEWFLKAIQIQPEYVYPYHNLGNSYYSLEEYQKAIDYYNKAIELDPNYSNAYTGLGDSYYSLKEYQKAIDSFNKVIELDPNNSDAYNGLGNSYDGLEKYQKAIDYYNKAIELNPNNSVVYNNLSLTYFTIKEYKNSIEAAKKAIELNFNEHKELYKQISDAYFNLKDYLKAKEFIDKYLEYFPDDQEAFSKLQQIYKQISKPKESLTTPERKDSTYKNLFLFINSDKSKNYFIEKLKPLFDSLSVQLTDSIHISDSLIIIQPFGFSQTIMELQNMVATCKEKQIPFRIYLMDEDFPLPVKYQGSHDSNRVKTNYSTLQKEYENHTTYFASLELLQNDLQLFLTSKPVSVKVLGLELENIGLFEKERFTFHPTTSVMIGLNGTGKTTVLRALALALIGSNHKATPNSSIQTLWNVQQWMLNKNQKGTIKIQYKLNSKDYENTIEFTRDEKTGEVFVHPIHTDNLFYGSYLKLPIIGFGQQRKLLSSGEKKRDFQEVNPASISDCTNLINNKEDDRLHSFVSWIANLKNESQKEGRKNKEDLIHLAFEILSKITNEEIRFKELRNVDPLDVWIITRESPEGIPIEYASQGCQTIMGWVGYIIERMYESYPYSRDFKQEPAIILIDEIDSFLHPKWQKSVLGVLLKTFPNAQIIASTHSPLVVDGLERNQIIQLSYDEKEKRISVQKNPVDIWVWNYEDILLKLFDVYREPEIYESSVLDKIEEIRSKTILTEFDKEKLEDLEEQLDRIEESRVYKDEIESKRKELREKEEVLDRLIEKYKKVK